jgi:hypothetical protein
VALLHQWLGLVPMLTAATDFYRRQLHRHDEAVTYLRACLKRCFYAGKEHGAPKRL